MSNHKNPLRLSFDSENLAVPEIHVEREDTQEAAQRAENKRPVPQEIKDFFAAERFATKITGIKIEEASENHSRCSLHVTEDHRNLSGDIMGGVLFTLADFSFAVATCRKHRYMTTLTSEIRFLAKAKGDVLYADCRVIRDGSRICFADALITDNTGVCVAAVSVSGMLLS